MKLLYHTRDLWEGRGGYVEDEWLTDTDGRYAFRARLQGDAFVVCALSEAGDDGNISFRYEVAKTAAQEDRYVVVRVRDDFYIFDGATALAKGNVGDPYDDDRAAKGEEWVYVPRSIGARFEDFVDGSDEPVVV